MIHEVWSGYKTTPLLFFYLYMVKQSLLDKHLVLPKDKLEYFKRHCGRISVEEMTKILGIDVREYCKIKKQLGLKGRYKGAERREIVKEHYTDMTFSEMAREYGGNSCSYSRYAKELGLVQPDNIILRGVRARVESREDWKRKHLYGKAK